jgi:CubicO group peptidase (beta-lactamase class C family)
MTRKRLALAAALVCLVTAVCAHAQSAEQTRRIDDLMSRYTGDAPGASLLVVRDGKAIVRRGYGYANLEEHVAAGPETNYRLASVTKQFTAACILLLQQDGKLRLEDRVREWLPELPASDDRITLYQLLTHTSGLIDYEDLIPPNRITQLDDADVLGMIASQHRFYFEPGSAYRYSNGGYVLLGLVVQRVSGTDLADFMKTHIFQPLGMEHTLMYEHHRGPQVTNRAYGYSEINGKWMRTDQDTTSATRGDGGIYSSIDDLAKWDAALYTDKLLSADSRRAAFTAHTATDDPSIAYGFGWRITGDTVWHSGESMGFRNVIVRWPKQHLAVILLSNRNRFQPYPLALAIGQLFLHP